MGKKWLFPKHSAFLSHCLENELRFLKREVLLHFSSLRRVFVKQASDFGHSWLLVTGWFSPVTRSSMRMSPKIISHPGLPTWLQLKPPPHSLPQQRLIISSTLQWAVQAQKSIWLPVQLCKIIPGEQKKKCRRGRSKGAWEGGKEQEWGHKLSQAREGWSLMAECLFWTVTWGLAGH